VQEKRSAVQLTLQLGSCGGLGRAALLADDGLQQRGAVHVQRASGREATQLALAHLGQHRCRRRAAGLGRCGVLGCAADS